MTRRDLYKVFLQSQEWRQYAGRVKARAAGRCEDCRRAVGQLDAHHLTYDAPGHAPPPFPPGWLPNDWNHVTAICRACHDMRHPEKQTYTLADVAAEFAAFCRKVGERREARESAGSVVEIVTPPTSPGDLADLDRLLAES